MEEEINVAQLSVESNSRTQFRIIKVPEFIAQAWLNAPVGTQIGVLTEPKMMMMTHPHSKQSSNGGIRRPTNTAAATDHLNHGQSASKKQRKDGQTDFSSSSAAKASISISSDCCCPVRKIHSIPVTELNNDNDPKNDIIISLAAADPPTSSTNPAGPTTRRPRLEGIVSASQSYLPDVMDPQYLEYLTSRNALDSATERMKDDDHHFSPSAPSLKPVLLSVAETNAMQKKFKGFDEHNQRGGDSRLFKYFNTSNDAMNDADDSGGGSDLGFRPDNMYSADNNMAGSAYPPSSAPPDGGGLPQQQFLHQQLSPTASGPMMAGQRFPGGGGVGGGGYQQGGSSGTSLTMSYEEAQEKLFHLFEAKGADGIHFRDIQQNIKMAPVTLKKLLDQIAEPQRERLGKRTVFVLKSQYRVMK